MVQMTLGLPHELIRFLCNSHENGRLGGMMFLFLSNTYRNFTDSSLSKPYLSGYDGALDCLLQAIVPIHYGDPC